MSEIEREECGKCRFWMKRSDHAGADIIPWWPDFAIFIACVVIVSALVGYFILGRIVR